MKRYRGYYKKWYQEAKSRPGFKEHRAILQRRRKYGVGSIPLGTLCAICQIREAKVIDHNHLTGQVRGFLCHHCNIWLAPIENSEFMFKAKMYLMGGYKQHGEVKSKKM